MQMISNKTGGLFRLALRLMASVSPVKVDTLPLAELLGLIFQIQDDYVNLASEEYHKSKGYCEDLTEGKFSFPIIHSVQNSPSENSDILNILKLKTEDRNLKAYAVAYMQNTTSSLEYTKEVLDGLHLKARIELEKLGGNAMIGKILDKLVVT